MRVVSFNCNGLSRYRIEELAEKLGAFDVLCLQEVRTPAIPELPGYVHGHSLHREGKKQYGVLTYARDATFVTPEWDREGRVVLAKVDELVIANVYAVNGTSKPYLDGTRHDFKREFIVRLAEELLPYRGRLIAIGDWNVSRAKIDTHPRLRTEEPHATARREFNEVFMPALDVVDPFRERRPEAREYTWFNTRARSLDAARVDFALVSRALMPRVTAAEIGKDRHGSDHAPIAITLG